MCCRSYPYFICMLRLVLPYIVIGISNGIFFCFTSMVNLNHKEQAEVNYPDRMEKNKFLFSKLICGVISL